MAEELKTMSTRQRFTLFGMGVVALVLAATPVLAQVPVDETGNEGIPLLTRQELQDLVGPVALYPDDLLAIVLPAATYPLQVVQASRFLEDLKLDPGLKPDPDWDDSIVALLNYPEIVELLNEDLDWTWQLGEAVVAQQADVVTAVEAFRNTAYAAGNLRSDDYQQVSRDEGVIEITPTNDDIIYVPYYEPERVVVYQPQRVYYYYERPYPVYYYPYSYSHAFNHGFFWGVTTAFTIGWASDSLHVYHHSYIGHPYYGHHYQHRYWYRRPSIYTHNTIYHGSHNYVTSYRHSSGDHWRSSRNRHLRYSDQRITRNTHYPSRNAQHVVSSNRTHVSSNRIVASNTQHTTSVRNRNDNHRRAAREVNERRNFVTRERTARRDNAELQRREPQQRSEPQRQARAERRSQPQQQARAERRSQPQQQARAERRSQPQQQARAERRSQPQQQARAERRSQPRTETRNKARKEDRSQERQSRGRGEPRRRKD
jgi:hypothetical protein